MQNRPELHHIQREILLNLATKSPQRFTELQPPRVANNTFSYHLKKLVDTGYIEGVEGGYTLTRKSLKLALLSPEPRHKFGHPRTITMVLVQNSLGEVLLMNRNTRPFQGWYGLPSGTIHFGETTDEAVARELLEKTTINATKPLKAVGVLDFQYRESETDDLFAHALAFIYSYQLEDDGKELKDKMTPYGQLSWSRLGRSHILPEVRAVCDMAEENTFAKRTLVFEEPTHVVNPQLVSHTPLTYAA